MHVREHHQGRGRQIACAVAASVLVLAGAEKAYAQAGIGVIQNTPATGTIGSNKGDPGTGAVACPAGQIMTGIFHRDKGVGGTASTVGMSAQIGIYCSTVSTDGSTVTLTQTTAAGTPGAQTFAYTQALTAQSAYCNTNLVGRSFFGWDRNTSNAPWTSAIGLNCAAIVVSPGVNWFSVPGPSTQSIDVGVRELNATHTRRGDFCGTLAAPLVTGLFAQAGGEGWDGLNVYCGRLSQARHSAIMTFTDFAWDTTLSTTGWRVNLQYNGTTMQSGSMTGADRVPYANAAANGQGYNSASEVYAIPNTNDVYGAAVSGRPASFSAAQYNNSYITTGTCVTRKSLRNEVDESCTLNVEGLPDLTPSVTSPATTYTAYNANQNMTIGVSNLGPGAVVAADGYTIDATLPAGWTAGPLPAGCTLVGQIVRCSVPALTAAATPGATGGAASWTFPVRATTSNNGTFTVPVVVNTSVPTADGNPANDDYNSANNSVNGQVILNRSALLRLSKVWANAVVNDQANLTATSSSGPTASLASVANTASETDNGATVQAPLSAVYNLSEVLPAANTGLYTASAWTCTGGTLSGSALTIRQQDLEQTVTCSITNTRQSADISVTKTANPTTVRTGQDITWTIVARNNGPAAANGATLTDTPGAGMNCTTPPPPPPACTTTGGATCPTTYTAAALAAGVTIPTFPSGSTVTITLTCRATASGI